MRPSYAPLRRLSFACLIIPLALAACGKKAPLRPPPPHDEERAVSSAAPGEAASTDSAHVRSFRV